MENRVELIGKIVEVLPVRSGKSERGEWMVASYILETSENYPKKVLFEVMGEDRIKRFNGDMMHSQNTEVIITLSIEATKYKDRWFNNVRAYDLRPYYREQQAPQTQAQTTTESNPFAEAGDNNRPF